MNKNMENLWFIALLHSFKIFQLVKTALLQFTYQLFYTCSVCSNSRFKGLPELRLRTNPGILGAELDAIIFSRAVLSRKWRTLCIPDHNLRPQPEKLELLSLHCSFGPMLFRRSHCKSFIAAKSPFTLHFVLNMFAVFNDILITPASATPAHGSWHENRNDPMKILSCWSDIAG